MNNDRDDDRTKIAIEDVLELWDKVREINDIPFEDIMWTLNGEELDIHRTSFYEWMESGLDNMTFVISGRHKWGNVLATLTSNK